MKNSKKKSEQKKSLEEIINDILLKDFDESAKSEILSKENPRDGVKKNSTKADGRGKKNTAKKSATKKGEKAVDAHADRAKLGRKAAEPKMTLNQYLDVLNEVIDPETGVGIVDMGLIYDVEEFEEGFVYVEMTFTSVTCPMGPQIIEGVKGALMTLAHVKSNDVNIVWDPPWTLDMMNPEVRAMLFGN